MAAICTIQLGWHEEGLSPRPTGRGQKGDIEMACRRGLQGACRLQMRRARITRSRALIGRSFPGRRSWAANWAPGTTQTGVAADRGSTPHPWTAREEGVMGRGPRAPTSPSAPFSRSRSRPGRQPRRCISALVPPSPRATQPGARVGCSGTLITNLAECKWESAPLQANQVPVLALALLPLPQQCKLGTATTRSLMAPIPVGRVASAASSRLV